MAMILAVISSRFTLIFYSLTEEGKAKRERKNDQSKFRSAEHCEHQLLLIHIDNCSLT